MCLSVAIARPDHVLARGEHLGLEWMIVHNTMGYRCGYVRLPAGHPWFGLSQSEQPGEVHGGITFSRADTPCHGERPDDGWWIGFDCAHFGDLPDPTLPGGEKSAAIYAELPPHPEDMTVKDNAYVEAECRSLCEQAAAL